MGLPCGRRHLDFSAVLEDLSAATRSLGTINEIQNAAGDLLQRSLFAARLCLELSDERLRAIRSRASIRTRYTEFPAMVSGTVDWSWHYAHRRDDLLDRAVRCVSASTSNKVGLWDSRCVRFLIFRSLP